ncbi:MAG: class I SAM-dependent methyltransferase, partial [Bdellovibrionales bacterium]|nr:class I SAM-dependent methyltransferase [Bdellovibrionales bacterium]
MIESGTKKRVAKKQGHLVFDKYDLYTKAVQSPAGDVEFLSKTYKEIKGKEAKSLREDFCGTFAISSNWVKREKNHIAYGVDLDPEPMEYGKAHYLKKLSSEQQKRLHLIEGDVLQVQLPKVDVTAALNFSYFLFKKRE